MSHQIEGFGTYYHQDQQKNNNKNFQAKYYKNWNKTM